MSNGTQVPTYTGPSPAACTFVQPFPSTAQKYFSEVFLALKEGHVPPPSPTGVMAAYAQWSDRNQLEDFGGNCRYQKANAALPAPSKDRIVFMGDSITELWGIFDPSLFTGDVIDRGVSGQTTAQMLLRFRQDVINLKPTTVHILAGVNDIAGNTGPTSLQRIEENTMTMVEMAMKQHIQVVVGSLTPSTTFSWKPNVKPASAIHEYNVWLKGYAHANGIQYVDYFSPLADEHGAIKSSLTFDGLHPNKAGFAIMSRVARQALHLTP
jgi:lysophospholipase L1-like esterase